MSSHAGLVDTTRRRQAPHAGFTLVEIMVALAIVAVALTTGMRAITQAADSATALKSRTLALWVAQNRLAEAQIASTTATPGNSSGDELQAGLRFVWRVTTAATPNPAFRRIEIVVAAPDAPDYTLAQLVGYVGGPAPQ